MSNTDIISILAGNTGMKDTFKLPIQSGGIETWKDPFEIENPAVWQNPVLPIAAPKSKPFYAGGSLSPQTLREISDYAMGKSTTLPGRTQGGNMFSSVQAEKLSGGTQDKPADSDAEREKKLEALGDRRDTIKEQIEAAKRMASYSGTGGGDLYASVQKTLEAELKNVNADIGGLTPRTTSGAASGADKYTVETSSAMGYNGSTIDPIHLLAGGLPGFGAENAYGGNPLFTGNYGVQPYQGQAFDNIQTLTSNAASGGAANYGAADYGAAQTSGDSADTELQKDLREQYYRHDLLAAQIEIAKKTESYAKTGDASRAARAVRDALNKELEKVNGRIEALEGSGDSYFERSADQVLYGNYSDDVTLLGTAGQIGLGLTGLDFAGDIRDLTYDITHWDGSLKHAGQTLLDVVGLIPGIGALKNVDEVAALLKQALKAAPALTDGAKYALKNVDVIAAGITGLFKNSDDLASVGKAAGKTAEDLAREYAETARLMKNADKADEAADAVSGAGKSAASEASDALGKAIDAAWDEGAKAAKGATEVAGETAKYFDDLQLKTEPNTAYFWSGNSNGIGGKDFAREYANQNSGTTLEMLIDGQKIPMPKWDFNDPVSIKAWRDGSEAYARQASGEVKALIGSSINPDGIWNTVELPKLLVNKKVKKIILIDPKTLAETIIISR